MTDFKEEGFLIDSLDLANDVSPGPEDDHRVYNHDGTSTLTLTDGSTTSLEGWYMWSNPDAAWFPMGQHADLVDGYHGADLAALAENETVSGSWKFSPGLALGTGNLDVNGNKLINNTGSDSRAGMDYRIELLSDSNNVSGDWRAYSQEITGNVIFANGSTGDVDAPNGNLHASGIRVHEGDHHPVSIPVTRWASGLSSEEIQRISVPTGKSLYVYGLEVALKGGATITTPSNFTVEVYDATNAVSVASDAADGAMSTGTPIGSSGDGAEVLIRITNSTGNDQKASIQANMVIK